MKDYTQQELDALIHCPKIVVEPPRSKMIVGNGQQRNDMKLQADGGADVFSVFIRINETLPENFSIGLRHLPVGEESAILLRCNGQHGPHQNHVINADHFNDFHIHYTTEVALLAGARLEDYAIPTGAYVTYEGALRHFLQIVNVIHPESTFPRLYQLSLLDETSEQ